MSLRNVRFVLIMMMLLFVALPLLGAETDSGFKLTRRVAIGGDGGWDYLTFDRESRRLFVARANRIVVLDVDNGNIVGEIPGTNGVHGVAIVPAIGRAVASNGKDDSVLIFDLKTLAPIATVKTGVKPDAIFFEELTGLVMVFNGKTDNVTLVDPGRAIAVSTIALPGRPETGVSDGKGRVFVNLEDKNSIAVIDMKLRKVVATWALDGCDEPTGLSYDSESGRLFSGCHNSTLVVVDVNTGKNVQKLKIGGNVDAVAFDNQKKLVFTSNGEGNVSVIRQESADKYSSYANVPTISGAKTLALDPDKHRLYSVANMPSPESPRKGTFHLLVIEQ